MIVDGEAQSDIAALPSWRGPFDFILENGLRVLFAQRSESPLVEIRLVIDGGFAADPDGRSGLASLATSLFGEGLIRIGGIQLASAAGSLGTLLQGQVMPDAAILGMSALQANFPDALRMFADALIGLEFKDSDFESLRANRLALIAGERLNPFELPLRILPPMIYGRGHPYARPFTGSGRERDVAQTTSDDVRSYYVTSLVPDRITLVVTGAGDPADLRSQLEKAFGHWNPITGVALPAATVKMTTDSPSLTIVNRGGLAQGTLAVGLPTIPRCSSHAEALMAADTILGGMFTSRLNLNLRERKGWTYGVRSSLIDTRLQGLWLIRTAVRADCTVNAMREIAGELEKLAGRSPFTAEEFSRAVGYLVARIPSSYETCAQMANALAHTVAHHLPISYPHDLANRLRRLRLEDVWDTCRQIIEAGKVRWMMIGDRATFLDQLSNEISSGLQVVDINSVDLG